MAKEAGAPPDGSGALLGGEFGGLGGLGPLLGGVFGVLGFLGVWGLGFRILVGGPSWELVEGLVGFGGLRVLGVFLRVFGS